MYLHCLIVGIRSAGVHVVQKTEGSTLLKTRAALDTLQLPNKSIEEHTRIQMEPQT